MSSSPNFMDERYKNLNSLKFNACTWIYECERIDSTFTYSASHYVAGP